MRPVATAGVLLFKGPQARRFTQGGAHKRRCTQKAEHTKGGLWPPQESCYLRGHMQGGTHTRRCTHKAVHTQGGAHTRRCTHKAVHTKGGVWPPQE